MKGSSTFCLYELYFFSWDSIGYIQRVYPLRRGKSHGRVTIQTTLMEHFISIRAKRPSQRSKPGRLPIRSGDIMSLNHTSYIDVLFLASWYDSFCLVEERVKRVLCSVRVMLTRISNQRYAPIFVTPTQTPGQVTVETVWSAFSKSVQSPGIRQTGELLSEVARKAKVEGRGPIVVFPEVNARLKHHLHSLHWSRCVSSHRTCIRQLHQTEEVYYD